MSRRLTSVLSLCCLVAGGSAFSLASAASPRTVARHVAPTLNMPQSATLLVSLIGRTNEQIEFPLVMSAIDELYEVNEVPFSVGDVSSEPGQNMGSAKIFSFASISKLDQATTLHLFGDYYRKDVLEHPDGTDHANIRAFMKGGWDCVEFPEGLALSPK